VLLEDVNMIVNSCNYPESCDCTDCEWERSRNRTKRQISQQLNKLKPKRKPLNYDSRKLSIKYYWDDVQNEYHESNNPTNIYNMFCEMLEAMPQDSLEDCETMGLFKSALEDTIGKMQAKTKYKTYI